MALLLGTGPSFLDEVFVLLIAADIDTIGSGNIHGTVLILGIGFRARNLRFLVENTRP